MSIDLYDYLWDDTAVIDVSTPTLLSQSMAWLLNVKTYTIPWAKIVRNANLKKKCRFISKFGLTNDMQTGQVTMVSVLAFLALYEGSIKKKQTLGTQSSDGPHFMIGVGRLERVEIGNLELKFKGKTYIASDPNVEWPKRCRLFVDGLLAFLPKLKKYMIVMKGLDLPIDRFTIAVKHEKKWKMKLALEHFNDQMSSKQNEHTRVYTFAKLKFLSV